METSAFLCMVFLEVVMVTGVPIFTLIIQGIDEKLSWVEALWSCLLQHAT